MTVLHNFIFNVVFWSKSLWIPNQQILICAKCFNCVAECDSVGKNYSYLLMYSNRYALELIFAADNVIMRVFCHSPVVSYSFFDIFKSPRKFVENYIIGFVKCSQSM